ncbi:MAG: hypothetical protein MHMPM18_000901 [Marteilia pararefringens]
MAKFDRDFESKKTKKWDEKYFVYSQMISCRRKFPLLFEAVVAQQYLRILMRSKEGIFSLYFGIPILYDRNMNIILRDAIQIFPLDPQSTKDLERLGGIMKLKDILTKYKTNDDYYMRNCHTIMIFSNGIISMSKVADQNSFI